MRRAVKTAILLFTMGIASAPTPARAEGFVVPWIGANFGNSQAEGKTAFGVSAGTMGAGIFGAEFDLGYSPDFFGESVSNNVLTAMGNLILGVPIGGTSGAGIRPYVTGGVGLIRTKILSSSDNDFGFSLGGGVMGFFSDHVGLRGDARFFRDFQSESGSGPLNLDIGGFHFWRASIGVVLR